MTRNRDAQAEDEDSSDALSSDLSLQPDDADKSDINDEDGDAVELAERVAPVEVAGIDAVSYTHLTLPTKA